MTQTLHETLADRATTHRFPPGTKRQGKLVDVNIAARRCAVRCKGIGVLRRVAISETLDLGTVDKPRIFKGNDCTIEMQSTGRWLLVDYVSTVRCNSTPVDTDSDYVRGFGKFELTPFTPMPAQVLDFGEISLPSQRLPSTGTTYDVGGGYAGAFVGPLTQSIGLLNGSTWGHFFVTMNGTANWTMVLNGVVIASGSGSAVYQALGSSQAFGAGSTFTFNITSGSGSDLFFGCGV